MRLAQRIRDTRIAAGQVGIFWAGQAGFIIKASSGSLIGIDLYLTDYCERAYGAFKRIVPSPLEPNELELNILLSTHHHGDHLDIDAIPELLNGRTVFAGPQSCVAKCKELGIPDSKLFAVGRGSSISFPDFTLTAVYADHGELAPDAVGFLLEFPDLTIYYSGDTAYCPDRIDKELAGPPDIMIVPINGKYGNLNPEEAARLAGRLGTRVVIPCHFWMFVEHDGDPGVFLEAIGAYAPGVTARVLAVGEGYIYERAVDRG